MLSTTFWPLLTRLGEAQILFPLVGAAAAWLWLGAGQGGQALRWLLSLAAAVALTTASKLAFIGWGWGIAAWDFTGISGHALCSAASLPMLAWVALTGRARHVQQWAAGLGLALAALVAYSRLEVNAHSASESISGFALGALVNAISLCGRAEAITPRLAAPLWLPAALTACLLLLPLKAPRSRSHDWITALSVQWSGRSQPFMRDQLHQRHRAPMAPAVQGPWQRLPP